jgi:hemolysin III
MFRQLEREEAANVLTHGAGIVLSLLGLFVLVYTVLGRGSGWRVAAVWIYGLTLIAVFTASTLYHWTNGRSGSGQTRWKTFCLWLDHTCIYALIAGTYTPYTLSVLKGTMAAGVLSTVWGLGVIGAAMSAVPRLRRPHVSVPYYLLTGWLAALVVHAVHPLPTLFSPGGLALLVGGGLCYLIGVGFFFLRIAYAHAVWHIFVLLGGGLHYFGVLLYATSG